MKKRLTLKKVTIWDLDESTLRHIVGAADTDGCGYTGPSNCGASCPEWITCGNSCGPSCAPTCADTCAGICAGTCDTCGCPGGGKTDLCTGANGDSCYQNCC